LKCCVKVAKCQFWKNFMSLSKENFLEFLENLSVLRNNSSVLRNNSSVLRNVNNVSTMRVCGHFLSLCHFFFNIV
jgi:hypothetical protein